MDSIKPTAKSATIAVIDEKVWRVRHLSEVLQRQGHKVLLLSAMHNALALLTDSRCDVVLTVEALGTTTGSALVEQVREKLGDRRPWFVLLSEEGVRPSAAVRAHYDVCVDRPIDDGEVVELVARAIVERRQAAAPAPVAAPAG